MCVCVCVCVCVHDFVFVQNVNKQDLCIEVNLQLNQCLCVWNSIGSKSQGKSCVAFVIGGAKFSTTLKLPIGMF